MEQCTTIERERENAMCTCLNKPINEIACIDELYFSFSINFNLTEFSHLYNIQTIRTKQNSIYSLFIEPNLMICYKCNEHYPLLPKL